MPRVLVTSMLVVVLLVTTATGALAHPDHDESDQKGVGPPDTAARRMLAITEAPTPLGFTPCVDGRANRYSCDSVDLLAYLPLSALGEGYLSDLWGWDDPVTGSSYALVGTEWGTTFVDVTNATSPRVVGRLNTATTNSRWRDIKVVNDHAVIVSEAPRHGMQIFDLSELRNSVGSGTVFRPTAVYNGFGNAHNVGVSGESGHAVVVGSNTCGGGLHLVDLVQPTAPRFAGCFSSDGYTHDVQCVRYRGPDLDHQGRDLCLASNEDTLTILDISTPSAIELVSRTGYPTAGYTHQGWLSDNQRWFVVNDELDEIQGRHGTRTYFWDLMDLDQPPIPTSYTSQIMATDHNLYVEGGYVYQANYRAGLRVLDMKGILGGHVTEVAHFDIFPPADGNAFSGAWTAYPFHGGDLVTLSGIEQGLFLLDFTAKTPAHVRHLPL